MAWLKAFLKRLFTPSNYARTRASMAAGMPSPGQMLGMIAATTEDEIDCGQAFELMHQYADLIASGQDAGALLPAVKKHIDLCKECRDELEALLRAVHAAD